MTGLLVILFTSVALAGEPETSEDGIGHANAIRQDAVEYAATHGVRVEEAVRRLELQPVLGVHLSEIEEIDPDRFAGGWIEHEPAYRAVVSFVGNDVGLAPVRDYVNTRNAPVEVRTGATHSLRELHDGLDRISGRLDTEFPRMASEIDVRAGTLSLMGLSLSERARADLEAEAGVPVTFVESAPAVDIHTYGGHRLTVGTTNECTAGFTVYSSSAGLSGVITAAHCADSLIYHENGSINYALTHRGSWYSPTRDVQWHTNSSHAVYDDFWDGDEHRDVAATVSRLNSPGDTVCHYGIGSAPTAAPPGYSCGTVVSTTYDPGDLCPAPNGACDNVWVRVEGSNLACYYGDSGGPVFLSTSAYGIAKAAAFTGRNKGQCTRLVYMSLDWLSGTGLSVLKS